MKETKNRKDEDETFVSISYMKVNLIFWGALQEKMHKVEHLGNKLFEAEDEIKALKGGEYPKAKAKSKTKNANS